MYPNAGAGSFTCPFALTAHEDLLFALTKSELMIHDLSDPAKPAELGRVSFVLPPESLKVKGDVAYVTSGQRLYLISVRNPRHPREIGQTWTELGGEVSDVGTHVYLTSDQLEIVDCGW